MNKTEIKTKWLEELRSGNHHQITGTLKDQFGNGEYGYCCLGVLAEKVMGLEVRNMDEDIPDDEGDLNVYKAVNKIIGDHLSAHCSGNNDEGWTFAEIADYIERNWNGTPKHIVARPVQGINPDAITADCIAYHEGRIGTPNMNLANYANKRGGY